MQFTTILALLSAAGTALAIQVTSPTNGTQWKDHDSNTITWTSVSSDPSSLSIFLVNEQVNPPVNISLATNIQTSLGTYTVDNLTGSGAGYQINLVGTENNGILAQSQQFELETGGGSSSSATTGASSTATATSGTATGLSLTEATKGTMSMTAIVATGTGSTLATVTTTKASGTATVTGVSVSGNGTATASTTAATGSSAADAKAVGWGLLGAAGLVAMLL